MNGLLQMGQRAMKLAELGLHAEAVALWKLMHRQVPDHADISMALGAALLAADRVDDALRHLVLNSQRHPAHKGLALLVGRTLSQKKDWKPAIGALYQALSLDPDCSETHAYLASALFWDRASAAALPHAERACQGPLTELVISTYVCVLLDLDQGERALAFLDRAIADGALGRDVLLLYRASALQELGRAADGLADAREVVRLSPGNAMARHHYAAALLLQGHLTAEAWAHYEGRTVFLTRKRWPVEHLRWDDQDVCGLTVLVHAEQGLGDTLQFIRYVPLLAARGARVVVAVQPALVKLLQGTPGAAEIVPADGSGLPPFDIYCPLLSLPGRLGTTLETIPPSLPYAIDFPAAPRRDRLQVGVVWAGQQTFIVDRKRSIDPALLSPLADVASVDFHSLQFGAKALPFAGMRDAMQGVGDFVDTAARIAELDLVIAVDTSVAHLAATMGKPVWLLNRYHGCWRWLLDREDSPWYPTVRQFRQVKLNDWASVIARVRDALAVAAHEHQAAMSLAA